MKKIIYYLKKPIFWVTVGIIFITIFLLFGQDQELDIDTETVSKHPVTEKISATARVTADQELSLSFEISGRLKEVIIDEGDKIEVDQLLARLDTDLLRSEVEEAEANLRSQKAQLAELQGGLTEPDLRAAETEVQSAEVSLNNAKENLSDIKQTERIKVANAKEDLLTTDLRARMISPEIATIYSFEPPEISGVFQGEESGYYRITLYRSQADSGYSFRYESNIDQNGTDQVSTNLARPLGTLGLDIIFPENFARHRNLEWLVEIPNRESPQYPILRQAYNNAKEHQETAIKNAERQIKEAEAAYEQAVKNYEARTAPTRPERVTAQRAAVEQANTALEAARTRLGKTELHSPIAGTVLKRHYSTGENISSGSPILSLISDDQKKLTAYIPEIDVANLEVGDSASVRFDTFPDNQYSAEVIYLSPTATQKEGVAVFKTELRLQKDDPRIRNGMTAEVDIISQEKKSVLAIPGRSIIRRNDDFYVRVLEPDGYSYRRVERGLRGSDGRVEIISGLDLNDKIITYATDEQLEQLTEHPPSDNE